MPSPEWPPQAYKDRLVHPRPEVGVRSIGLDVSVLELIGEHDLSTSRRVVEAFDRARATDVIVDLTPCAFVDTSIIGVLYRAAEAGLLAGQRVEIVAPEDGVVRRTLEFAGLDLVLPLHGSLDRALGIADSSGDGAAPSSWA